MVEALAAVVRVVAGEDGASIKLRPACRQRQGYKFRATSYEKNASDSDSDWDLRLSKVTYDGLAF